MFFKDCLCFLNQNGTNSSDLETIRKKRVYNILNEYTESVSKDRLPVDFWTFYDHSRSLFMFLSSFLIPYWPRSCLILGNAYKFLEYAHISRIKDDQVCI